MVYDIYATGFILGVLACVMAITLDKGKYPYNFINFEQRQGNLVMEVLKGREVRLKDGTKEFYLRPTIASAGLSALTAKNIQAQVPEKSLAIIKKGGGTSILTFSPSPNIYLPIAFSYNKDYIDMIVQDTDVRNWYRGTVERIIRMRLLNPQTNWEKYAPLIAFGTTLLCVVLIIIVLGYMSSNYAAAASHIDQVAKITQDLFRQASTAAAGSNVIY